MRGLDEAIYYVICYAAYRKCKQLQNRKKSIFTVLLEGVCIILSTLFLLELTSW